MRRTIVFVIGILVSITQTIFCADIIVNSTTKINLPLAGTAGRLYRVTDDVGGLWMDQGSQWFSVSGEVINVKEFGAKADGTTDDVSAIQSAIDAAEARGGGIVWFPTGVYNISSSLTIAASTKPISLVGSGWESATPGPSSNVGTRVKNTGTGAAITIGDAAVSTTKDVRILNFDLVGNNNSSHGILVQRVHSMTIEGMRIQYHGGSGIYLNRSYASRVNKNYINNNTLLGIQVTYDNSAVNILDNRILENTNGGILIDSSTIDPSSTISIKHNDIESNGYGITVNRGTSSNGPRSINIVANHFENQTGKNMSIAEDNTGSATVRNPLILGNFIQGNIAATNIVSLDVVSKPVFIGNAFISSDLKFSANVGDVVMLGNTFDNSARPSFDYGTDLDGGNIAIRTIGTPVTSLRMGTITDLPVHLYANNSAQVDIDSRRTRFMRSVRHAVTTLTYGTTVNTDASLGNIFLLTATDGVNFTIANPTNSESGMIISYRITNLSGGGMGTITWGNNFVLAGAFTNPANGKARTITFYYDGAWWELSRVTSDL